MLSKLRKYGLGFELADQFQIETDLRVSVGRVGGEDRVWPVVGELDDVLAACHAALEVRALGSVFPPIANSILTDVPATQACSMPFSNSIS